MVLGFNLVLYEITVTNTGTDDLENVVVTDTLLEGIITGPTKSLNPDNVLEPLEKIVMTPDGTMMLQVDLALTSPDCPVDDLGCRLDLQPIYF